MKLKKLPFLVVFVLLSMISYAQEFDAKLQLRPRYEFRNGFKAPIPYGVEPASFVSQRSRLNLNFTQDKLVTKFTIQNIRVWGDVNSTAVSDVNGIEVFEAWAMYNFDENWSAKMGRQEISYDNQRILGGLDWAQQGQSHDALRLTYKNEKSHLDVGYALSAMGETLVETPYTVASYKNMQFAWYHTSFNKLNGSLLFLNTGYQFANVNADLFVDYMQTFGTYLNTSGKNWDANAWFYGQTGKSNTNSVSAWDAAANFNYVVTEKFKIGIGYEFLSGKSQLDTSTDVKSFYPLFGTNHGFNGYMDYFYVGNYRNTVGLQDLFLKFNYNVSKWQFALMPHVFNAANTVVDGNAQTMESYLGTEVDITAGYVLQKYINITGGYSQMFATDTMQLLKGGDVDHTNNWAWIMINVDPTIFTFKKQ